MANPLPALSPEPRRNLEALLLVGLLIAALDAATSSVSLPLLALASICVVVGSLRTAHRTQAGLCIAVVLLDGARDLALVREKQEFARRSASERASRVASAQRRLDDRLNLLRTFSTELAALPDVRAALGGGRDALSRLFSSLETLRERGPQPLALGIHTTTPRVVAWAGPVSEIASIGGSGFKKSREVALLGSVSTTLLVAEPIRGPGGTLVGVATAELPVAVHRNIHNAFLRDFDLLQGGDVGLDVRYIDSRDAEEATDPSRTLVSREGSAIAVVTAVPKSPEEAALETEAPFQRGVSALSLLALLVWAAQGFSWSRVCLAALAIRGVLLVLGPPLPRPGSSLLSPGIYASPFFAPSLLPTRGNTALALTSLLGSPLDLLFTTSLALVLSVGLAFWAGSRRPARASSLRAFAADLLSLPVLYGVFAWLQDTQANASVDMEAIALVPRSLEQLVLQIGGLFILGTGLALLVALHLVAGPSPDRRGLGVRVLAWAVLGLLFSRSSLGALERIPPYIAALLLILALFLVAERERIFRTSLGWIALGGSALLASLLYPSLLYYELRAGRSQIQRDYAAKVLGQPEWRSWLLSEARNQIDSLPLLTGPVTGPGRPRDAAFAVWSKTDLATVGSSSAVEIQDSSGYVVSRFAMNFPTLETPWRILPDSDEWVVTRERQELASAERPMLHAERRLRSGSEVLGAVHVYIGDDFWNLPFITSQDPYFELFRTASGGAPREHNVALIAWNPNRSVLFSSLERPPSLDETTASRLKTLGAGEGLWTSLIADGASQNAYLFSDEAGTTFALAYPRRSPERFAADFVEAISGLTLVTLLVLVAIMIARTSFGWKTFTFPSLLRAVRERFVLRLFVAFLVVAAVPVVVLEVVVRSFVTDRLATDTRNQALERAGIARKAVEDALWFQKDEPLTDATLVWISSLIKGDLDEFEGGKLVASSKRELYASGLLSPWVSGDVFRALALEAQPARLRTDTIGSFRFLVVAVPLRTGTQPRILSIPLALRQREMEVVLEDLDRTILLAMVLFLAGAAGLGLSVARRISGPISDLTRATREVAEGNLEARVVPTSRDELSLLVESFNQMASDLDRQRHDLEYSNRLAAWGEMARQVAHEVKNPLTPIQLSAEHLQRVYKDPSVDFAATLQSCTDTILRQVRELRGIVTEFSAFARPPATPLEKLEVKTLLETLVPRYKGALPRGVRMDLEAAETPSVRADRRLLERAILNLIENALQAVGESGVIVIRLRYAKEKSRVEVEVEDSGPGVDPEIQDRVFEPFFSTKTSGSGLGLAIVKKTLEDHGGGASLETRPGCTRALLWLPVDEATPGSSGTSGSSDPGTASASTSSPR